MPPPLPNTKGLTSIADSLTLLAERDTAWARAVRGLDIVSATHAAGGITKVMEQMKQHDALFRQIGLDANLTKFYEQQNRLLDFARMQRQFELVRPDWLEEAEKAAKIARAIQLPPGLEAFRTSYEPLTARLSTVMGADWWKTEQHLKAFTGISAYSDVLASHTRAGREIFEAMRAMDQLLMPALGGLQAYRELFDSARLILPRWPRARLLTRSERRRQIRHKLQQNAEPTHVRKAKSMVHRYELVLRETIDEFMSIHFGDAWPNDRLAECDCKDLLGKWRKRGGFVLDHADYAHYARIMSHPEHFAAAFATGFDDAQELHDLLVRAGRLRAASHHGREFTPEDLRDLRVVWRTLEMGLAGLEAMTIEFD